MKQYCQGVDAENPRRNESQDEPAVTPCTSWDRGRLACTAITGYWTGFARGDAGGTRTDHRA